MKKIITCTTVALFVCCCLIAAQNKKTTEWQPNTTLTIYDGAGMRPEWSKIIISDTACWYITGGSSKDVYKKFSLTRHQLNLLLKFVTANQLQQMHKHQLPALTLDKGTSSIALEGNAGNYYASESHSMSLEDGWHEKFNAISSYVYGLLDKAK